MPRRHMTDRATAADAPGPDRLTRSEYDRLAHAVTDRFAAHVDGAAAAVRDAEHDLATAREALASAEERRPPATMCPTPWRWCGSRCARSWTG
jgi:hypothetical protein